MDDEDFEDLEDLFAESNLLANLPQNALTLGTSPMAQDLGQEEREVTGENTWIDGVLVSKVDRSTDLPSHAICHYLSLPNPVLTPSSSPPSDTTIGHENENTFQSSYLQPLPESARLPSAGVISKIEATMESLADGILDDRESLAIPLRTRASKPKPSITPHSGAGVANNPHQPKEVCFPGSTPQEAWRFTVLVRLLELIHEALVDNKITTKRDIYYKDPSLFRNQEVVDRYIDDLAYTFEVSRSSLNVVAAAKGLVIGRFSIRRSDGTAVNGRSEHEGMIVPEIQNIDDINISWAAWILVVEKEATFRSLAAGRFYQNPRVGDGIIITAKGYPDISTRAFLRSLSLADGISSQPPPVFALVDFDPDGIGILANYKYGSFRLAHEDAELNVPETRWLGIQSRDILAYARSDTCDSLLRLTARDRRKATLMLGKETFAEDGPEVDWRRELQVMLMMNVKAEIQLMSGREGGLEGWLEERVGECLKAERSDG